MKNKRILSFTAFAMMLFSCDDTIMEWEQVNEDDQITQAELPLGLEEKISRYAPLKTYSDYVIGCGIVMDLYVNDAEYRNLVNENYDDVTVGYAMKHGAMVNAQGEINFNAVDNFIALTNEAGIDVYGHTLVWHANQNASYLNGLIASTVIPGSSGSNALDLSGLKDGTLTGWGAFNAGDGISILEDNGLSGTSQAVQLISGAASAQPYELQLITPNIPVVMGNNYEVSFYIKSDQPGQGRISFSGLENNYPYQDWYNMGGEFTESFATNSQWQQVKFTVNDFTDTTFGMAFDLGYLPGVTYYIDVDNISVVDLDAEPSFVNLITNGDFENGTLDGWGGYGNGSTREVTAEGSGFGDTGYAMVLTNPTEAQSYEAQQLFTFDQPLEAGTDYTCSFWVKASSPSTLQFELQSEDYSGDYYGGISVGTDWMQITQTVTPSSDDRIRFIFDFGESATTYTIDDIVFTSGEVSGGSEPTIIEKTDEEKTAIIGEAMENWIAGMVGHYKDEVFAWDVVNEPMLEGGSLRTGNVTELAGDDFYWVKYLGPDYAVTAFNLARQYGNPTDVLFINDYNLEASLAKCDGIIEYTNYIESQGATVDGIGTQMHISLNTSRENIVEMFKKLAASGKLIKISELDVRLGTAAPTMAQLIDQADMYQFVVNSFNEYIPANQRYGITLWNLSDKANEHEFWLPNESPNVFDSNFGRKPAYKGVADGLAGRDVSEDFTGEIQN